MENSGLIPGFSKLTPAEKTELIAGLTKEMKQEYLDLLKSHRHPDPLIQEQYQQFSENTLSNFFLPYGIAPNFIINGKVYHVPMVVEESSVVAAASSAAKFWSGRGGFRCEIVGTVKTGQIHFTSSLTLEKLQSFLTDNDGELRTELADIEQNMRRRGGGMGPVTLKQNEEISPHYFQLLIEFETVDSMGANFINSCLERFAGVWMQMLNDAYPEERSACKIIMAILSNYTPECLVRCRVTEQVNRMQIAGSDISPEDFTERFLLALRIAQKDTYRAVTHNKGIFNGIDAVVIATGNDFRAVEAGGHAYASRNGSYASLSRAWTEEDFFHFELEVPLALGTVGGLTSLHPLAAFSLKVLGEPDARELMKVAAAAGLANNFSAVKSLVTSGIQKGHMKLHLSNLLSQFKATQEERLKAESHFLHETVSFSKVRDFLEKLRD